MVCSIESSNLPFEAAATFLLDATQGDAENPLREFPCRLIVGASVRNPND